MPKGGVEISPRWVPICDCGIRSVLGWFACESWCSSQPLLWHLYFVVYWHMFLGISAGFLRILPKNGLHCDENLFWVIFAKIHQL